MVSARITNNGQPAQTSTPGDKIVADNPIDETVLDQLRFLQKEGKPNFPAMIIGLFLDTTPDVLKELEAAAQVGDVSTLRMASHKLISASEIVGAQDPRPVAGSWNSPPGRGRFPTRPSGCARLSRNINGPKLS